MTIHIMSCWWNGTVRGVNAFHARSSESRVGVLLERTIDLLGVTNICVLLYYLIVV